MALVLAGMVAGSSGAMAQVSFGQGRAAAPDPDWPCVQVQVPTLTAGQIWTGDPIDGREDAWRRTPELEPLLTRALDRRIPVETVESAIAEQVAGWSGSGVPNAEVRSRLTDLFAGIFSGVNGQRDGMMAAIRNYARQQRERLDGINAQLRVLGGLAKDSAEYANLAQSIEFQRRIVDERRRSQVAICEQPVRLERRLGRLARAIAGHLPPP